MAQHPRLVELWNRCAHRRTLLRGAFPIKRIRELDPRLDNHPLIAAGLRVYTPDVHSSSITQYLRCPREYMLSERFHLQRAGRYDSALNLGSFYHLAMAAFENGGQLEDARGAVDAAMAELLQEVIDASDTGDEVMGTLPGGRTVQETMDMARQDAAKALVMASWSWAYRPLPKTYTIVAVEMPIRVKYLGNPAILHGTIDLLLHDTKQDVYWIDDHKTSSFDPAEETAMYPFAVQPRIYRKLCMAAFPDKKIIGVCHSIIQKPTIRLKKNQTFDDYLVEVTKRYGECPADKPPFVRSWVRFGQEDEADREADKLTDLVGVASRAFPRLDAFPRVSSGCRRYGKMCQYLPICASPAAHWKDLIEVGYAVRHRDDDTETEVLDVGDDPDAKT